METDILIIYEHKTRELENSCLLMAELKRRGYKVEICNVYDSKRFDIHPKLMIVPHLYNEEHLNFTCNNRWHDCKCIIDMQYEQVLSKSSENGVHNPSGQAAYAHHIAWGDLQLNRYLNHGISPELVHKTGHVTMDFIKPRFRSFFLTKEQLAKAYNIDGNKEWVLFISSFSYVNRTEAEMKQLEKLSSTARSFCEFSVKSFEVVIPWLKQAAKENPDKVFIYRPHPGEIDNPILKAVEEEIPNFVLINALSVKQWIIASDRLYTWFSTSISEAFYAEKNCQIIRPVPINPELEVSIMEDAQMITRYEEFSQSLKTENIDFPITESAMTYAYGDTATYAYVNIANLCEQLIKGELKQYDYVFNKTTEKPVKHIFWLIFAFLSKHVKAPWIPALQNNYYYKLYRLYNKEMYGVKHLVKDYEKLLTPILEPSNSLFFTNGERINR